MTATTKPHSLSNLPDEVLNQIVEHLPKQRDLYTLCLVNHRINSIADPILYKSSISWNEPHHHIKFSQSLANRPRRGSLINQINLDYPNSQFVMDSLASPVDGFSYSLSTMSNLEQLNVSVPQSLCHKLGLLFNSPFDLASLKICWTPSI
jgi:hypothetical protein